MRADRDVAFRLRAGVAGRFRRAGFAGRFRRAGFAGRFLRAGFAGAFRRAGFRGRFLAGTRRRFGALPGGEPRTSSLMPLREPPRAAVSLRASPDIRATCSSAVRPARDVSPGGSSVNRASRSRSVATSTMNRLTFSLIDPPCDDDPSE
ncbi:MAG: hypothetical protein ACREIV_08315, partial [Planctomycetaceae bacterium]